MTDKNTDNDKGQSQVILETRPRTKKPSMYKVIMLNDDYTPMEFVVYVLQRFFGMSSGQATAIMLKGHPGNGLRTAERTSPAAPDREGIVTCCHASSRKPCAGR